LQTSQSSDHDDSDAQTIPETHETNTLVNPAHSGTGAFTSLSFRVEFRDHDVGGVGHGSAEDTGNVTSDKGDLYRVSLCWTSGMCVVCKGVWLGEEEGGMGTSVWTSFPYSCLGRGSLE
jgi:hypothetical protein